jgi:hypothetical protein
MHEESGASVLLEREVESLVLVASTDPIAEEVRALRQGAGDGEGQGWIAVDAGRTNADAAAIYA